ncbi:MAG: protein kinase [Acidobacteriota bacterium]
MTIAQGTQLGPYDILSALGAGGMGEVWRARDTRLNREVAIKVLPASFANDENRLRRFEQEALATSALNHPNILTIYDIGTHEHSPYIVAELLEGADLRAQLNGGALTVRKAIDYAQQITRGLAAAHEKGILHRDLKPENLFLTKDGRVKILDFGLSKLTQPKLGHVDTEAPTSPLLTESGVVMGTVGYLSPEQARGERADYRADIFAFGAILYELVTGQRAFQGKSAVEVMHAILKEEPPELSETSRQIPPQLERIVRRCLEKKPEQRFQSTSDLSFALEALSAPSGSNQTLALKALPDKEAEKAGGFLFKRERWLWLAASVLLTTAALALALLYVRQPSREAQVTRFSINLPKGTNTVAIRRAPGLALSPDGRRLAFSAEDAAGKNQLWLRALDSFSAQPLSGTDGAEYPFWSPDGRYIAFFAGDKLKKLDVGSGVIETVCPTGRGQGGDWNRQGVILFSNGEGTPLSQVNAAGGKPEAVTELDAARGETLHNFPSFLPDGRHFLFQLRGRDNTGIYVGSLDDRNLKLLLSLGADDTNSTRAIWSPPGYILYALNRTTLLAHAFDPDRLELQGEPFRVAENIMVTGPGIARFTVSTNGVLAFIQGGEADTIQLTWRNRSGERLGVAGPAAPWTFFSLSPDERFVALIRDEPSRLNSLWVLDPLQGATTRLSFEWYHNSPVWSPDGKQLAFSSASNSPPNLFLKPLAGNVPEERLLESRFVCQPSSWSPDGKFLIYRMIAPQTREDIWLLPLSGDRKPQPLFQTKFNEQLGRVSPDGNWLAYQSDESGSNEVYVTQFPQPARSSRISTSGGVNPHWRGDGKELFFVSGNKLMAASVSGVSGGAEFQAGAQQALFEIEGTHYAPSNDGQRFLVSVVTEKAPAPPINLVLNWTAAVKK